jgi:hypothetical protein
VQLNDMGKIYKDKKGSSCKMCKPHKNKWADKNKLKIRDYIRRTDKQIKELSDTNE